MAQITHDLRDTLEGTEVEIYRLLCENLSNQEIADQLDMRTPTVKWHLRNIYRKLGVEAKNNTSDTQSARRRAILYAGTRIEQVVSFKGDAGARAYTLAEIRSAAKKVAYTTNQVDSLISLLEIGV